MNTENTKEVETNDATASELKRLLCGVDFSNSDITERAKKSPLWDSLSKQNSEVLPYLLERYLLLENWRFLEINEGMSEYDLSYIHLLMADMVTVLLSYEQRIRELEDEAT